MASPLNYYIYDLETFKEQFLFSGKFRGKPEIQTFEISKRRNDRDQLLQWLGYLQNSKAVMVGFNNLGFDYPILHLLLNEPYTFTQLTAYLKGQEIIKTQEYGRQSIRPKDRIIPQIDLIKINHFDSHARRTSLKSLQFAMRSESVEDLPYAPDGTLTEDQMNLMIKYNHHDILETEKFFDKSEHLIDIRHEILTNGVLQGDVYNYSDVKLGTEYLIKMIGRAKCYNSDHTPRQTLRDVVYFKDMILKKIWYRTEAFQKVHEWFLDQKIWISKEDERPKLETTLAGLQFHFGVGGVHASVENKYFESNDDFVIRDIDVSGMYVAITVVNGFHPQHLGQDFVAAFKNLYTDRKQYGKGTVMNLILKLAGNGAVGNGNNSWSSLYDPQFGFSIPINGQLQALQLVEMLSLIPSLQVIQANTDGVTVYMHRSVAGFFDTWKKSWEIETGLQLEEAEYTKMWIRDVNNYIAIDKQGNIKRKGAYWYPINEKDMWGSGSGTNWNKDLSNMAVQKGIERVLLTGCAPEEVIKVITDPFDFMIRYKTTAGAKVYIGDQEMSKTVRYYVSTQGQRMQKVSKPKGEIGSWKRKNGMSDQEFHRILSTIPEGAWDERVHTKNKSKYNQVVTSIESGRLVKCCNKASDFNWSDVDFDYYSQEIKKLLIGENNGKVSIQPTTT